MKSIILISLTICILCIALAIRSVSYKNQADENETELTRSTNEWSCRCREITNERDSIRREYNTLLEKHTAILSEAQQLKSYRTSHNYVEVCEREHAFVTKLINEE